jgi:ABC-type sugar transport system permease subunit
MKTLRYLLINSGFAICVYYGLYEGNQGAENLAIFYIWVIFVLSLFLFNEKAIKALKEKKLKPSVPKWLDATFDFSLLAAIIYSGWVISGIAYLIQLLIMQNVYDEIYEDGDNYE